MALDDIAREAAAGDTIKSYMHARGIRTAATLALLSKDEEALDTTLIQPLLQGWECPDGSKLEVPQSDHPIAKAVIIHMWMLAQQHYWAASQAAMKPLQQATPSQPVAAVTTPSEDKVPKNLPPGRWAKLLAEYQSQQIDNEDRIFPVQELLGAEPILARVLHEHEVSKTYTPIQLGEIITCRTFQANGEPNPLAKKERNVTKLTLTGEQLVASPEEPWQPRSVLAIIDGLTSIRWAYVLCRVGTERSIHTFFDWLVRLVRGRPLKTDQVAQYWMTVSWRLALDMRAGKTFAESTALLMKDYDTFSECMGREATPPNKKIAAPATTAKGDKGQGKGNTKSGKHRPTPYGRPQKPQGGYAADRTDKSGGYWMYQKNDDKSSSWSKDSWTSEWKAPSK